MLKKFISYYKPYKVLFALDMFASLLISLIGMFYPIITRNMLNDYIPNHKEELIIQFGLILLAVYIARFGLKYFVNYYGHLVGVGMINDMRRDILRKIETLPCSYFDNHETGRIMSRVVNDLNDISELAHHGPENFFLSLIMIILSFIYLSSINIYLTLIIYACLPFVVFVAAKLRHRMRQSSKKSKEKVAIINAMFENSISGIRVTKAFNRLDKEEEKFNDCAKQFYDAKKVHLKNFSIFNATNSFITDIFNVITLLSGGLFLYNGLITFGDYSTFIVSVNLFISPINTLINFMEQFQEGASGFERFCELMEVESEKDSPNAIDVHNLKGDIEYKNVSFSYNEEKHVLDDISFKLDAGKTLALVGQTGGGKTTICHLLPRFYEIDSGSIFVDGINIKDITLESLRDNIGIVQQDVFLFTGTFKDNIAYGRKGCSEEEIIEAAKKANIYDYIMSLPNGFNSQIGERGIKLSGGQKQRLSIARAFLKNPPILILDEATSALDNTTELLIQEALDSLKKGRTTIVVAHRLSTIRNADKILVINKGKIIEEGSHQELINIDDGIYNDLYNSQFK